MLQTSELSQGLHNYSMFNGTPELCVKQYYSETSNIYLLSRKRIRSRSKLFFISICTAISANLSQIPFKLQMFGSKTCHVCAQLDQIRCPRLDENDGRSNGYVVG